MNLTKSNVQRLLTTLVELGYAQKDPLSGRYRPTLRMWEFGYKALSRDRVRLSATPHLRRLYEECQETVFLCVADGLDIVYVDKIESNHSDRALCMVGMRVPAIQTAAGRTILAFRDEEKIECSLNDMHVTLPNDSASDSLADMHRRLVEIRKDGYALSLGEFRRGTNSLAAPIWGTDGKAVASVVVNGSSDRLTPQRLFEISSKVCSAATRISEAIGYRPR